MSPGEFRASIAALGLNLSTGARFLRINRRTARSYASGRLAVPSQTAMLLSVMVALHVTPEQVAEPQPHGPSRPAPRIIRKSRLSSAF
jgi:hypothetical protein